MNSSADAPPPDTPVAAQPAPTRRLAKHRRRYDFGLSTPADSEAEGWLLTYLDTLTLMLALFVVMLALAPKASSLNALMPPVPVNAGGIPNSEVTAVTPEITSAAPAALATPRLPDDAQKNPFSDLPTEQLPKDFDWDISEGTLSVRVSNDILFDSGAAELTSGGMAMLDRLLPLLQAGEHSIAVEGHTDARPIRTRQFPSNWELSTHRAAQVVRYLQSRGIAATRLRAIGYADTQPALKSVNPNDAHNRRVELRIEATASKDLGHSVP